MCETLRAESWTLNTNIYKRLAAFKRKVLRRIFGGIKVNENWRKRYKKEIMQLFGNLDIFYFVIISQSNVNRMDSKRKVLKVILVRALTKNAHNKTD